MNEVKLTLPILAPSLLSADFSKLREEMQSLEKEGVSWFHIDVMDGYFVPNMTLGPVVVESIRKVTKAVLDCHLMVNEPAKFIPWFVKAGADFITFHVEASTDIKALLSLIRNSKVKAGISIKPNTAVQVLAPYLSELDMVLVMSVEPGFGGQLFKPESLEKVKWLVEQKKENGFHYLIEIDGGMNAETAKLAKAAGVEIFVAGAAVFNGAERRDAVERLYEAIRS